MLPFCDNDQMMEVVAVVIVQRVDAFCRKHVDGLCPGCPGCTGKNTVPGRGGMKPDP